MAEGIGVIVGRFQTPVLTDAHRAVYHHVKLNHEIVVIVVGVSAALNTRRNPLDYPAREAMLKEAFPSALIIPLHDQPTNSGWSRALDTMLMSLFPNQKIFLYGGRECFFDDYSGRFPLERVEVPHSVRHNEATIMRQLASRKIISSHDFRAGMIYSAFRRYPTAYSAVDIALVTRDREVLVVRKRGYSGYCFPGGFVDPQKDDSFLMAAQRELAEETPFHVQAQLFDQIGNIKIQDWRYRQEDGLYSTFFYAEFKDAQRMANRNIHENDTEGYKFLPIDSLDLNSRIEKGHEPLLEMLKNYMQERQGEEDAKQNEPAINN